MGLSLVGLATVALSGSAAAGALGACPAGAPLRHFDVQAIDVRITLNRFGDNDPIGKMYVLSSRVAAVRAAGGVAQGLDRASATTPIQPLVIRANEGDCVEIAYTNNATGGEFGIHVDGLAYDIASSGDQVGLQPSSAPAPGGSTTYHYYVPNDTTLEGAHYMRPRPGQPPRGRPRPVRIARRRAQGLDLARRGRPAARLGLGGDDQPAQPAKAFREYALLCHEIGNEQVEPAVGPYDKNGVPLPTIDKHTGAYRPGSRAINYRSEPFMNRLDKNPDDSQSYGSYDTSATRRRRWRAPTSATRRSSASCTPARRCSTSSTCTAAASAGASTRPPTRRSTTQKTGLDKSPKTQLSPSTRLDSQATGPGESYNLEIEGGAGGVQQAAGDFLYHCHIA